MLAGWLAKVIIKVFMQSLWLLKCDWDDILSEKYSTRWAEYYNKLDSLLKLKIPRFINISKPFIVEIYGFVDASIKAYAAVIFLRIINEDGVSVILQCSKTRVAPTKTLSIPRLELSATQLLAKLVKHSISLIPAENPRIHLWSDSKDTLF